MLVFVVNGRAHAMECRGYAEGPGCSCLGDHGSETASAMLSRPS